ncbi:hypothetical protein G7K_4359-t1 [Saitoella complicata NRRL Y-17804]|uniref:Uncharacterized protein n=1 Tax=Saitoella complicata (strain BCRC 22490 / CBS 7301 / JCM 7358 / NBRC 10748 / NRRL Y-17804) TaxID=698492 RepID=A0A0E9NK20_SAICN|nr:hypothetical protein G7K_4359-t1 [Saitoella complicata NRRL Y-17804]
MTTMTEVQVTAKDEIKQVQYRIMASQGWNPGLDDANLLALACSGGYLIPRQRREMRLPQSSHSPYTRMHLFSRAMEIHDARSTTPGGDMVIGLDAVEVQRINYAKWGFEGSGWWFERYWVHVDSSNSPATRSAVEDGGVVKLNVDDVEEVME